MFLSYLIWTANNQETQAKTEFVQRYSMFTRYTEWEQAKKNTFKTKMNNQEL